MRPAHTVPRRCPRPLLGAVAFFLLAAAGPLLGQQDCGALSQQQPMNVCVAERARRSSALLDSLIQDLRGHLNPTEYAQLLNVQHTWAEYRDSHCKWQAHFFEGGSIQPTQYATCVDALTWNRIDELKVDLCEGYGMTGDCRPSARYDRPRSPAKHE